MIATETELKNVSQPIETKLNQPKTHLLIPIGALLAGIAVAAGAFGAHGLKNRLSAEELAIWETAVRYQMYHAIGMMICGVTAMATGCRKVQVAGWLFLLGIAVFSGCLYALALTGIKVLGAIVPFGGAAFILGWLRLSIWGWKRLH